MCARPVHTYKISKIPYVSKSKGVDAWLGTTTGIAALPPVSQVQNLRRRRRASLDADQPLELNRGARPWAPRHGIASRESTNQCSIEGEVDWGNNHSLISQVYPSMRVTLVLYFVLLYVFGSCYFHMESIRPEVNIHVNRHQMRAYHFGKGLSFL